MAVLKTAPTRFLVCIGSEINEADVSVFVLIRQQKVRMTRETFVQSFGGWVVCSIKEMTKLVGCFGPQCAEIRLGIFDLIVHTALKHLLP